ncbi:MAG: efflux RND transporter periplasmic adaptor subunit [Deltaproteobacteria bacterium]|nr:efflux RND transporter periplasmic adaptor subunit [Deltaproteobacteria bacterium]
MKFLNFVLLSLLLAGCAKTPEARTVTASPQTVTSTVSSVNSGTVRAEKVAELAFGAVGRVKVLNVRVGDNVKKGQVLAELENDDLISMLTTAQQELVRRTQLRTSKAVAESELDQIRREVRMTQVAYDKSRIIAPYDGVIAELNLEVGQLSQITAVVPRPLMKIVDLDPRYVRAEIDEADLARVKVGQEARVKILALSRDPFPAIVRKVVPYISTIREQDRTAEIELTVDSGGTFLPAGASADVEVIIDTHKDTLAVPTRAVMGRGKQRHVFVLEGGYAYKRPIEVGLFNYDLTEVLSGVKDGEVVVLPTEGIELVDGMRLTAAPHKGS